MLFLTDRCCYFYHGVPQNVSGVSCNPQGRIIELRCQVYIPRHPQTTISVEWFKGPIDIVSRGQGERIVTLSDKYLILDTPSTTAVNDSGSIVDGLYLDNFRFVISNFNSTIDDGSYWCQLSVNNTRLRPSNIGSIAFSSLPVDLKCPLNSNDFVHIETPPVCAEETVYPTAEILTTTTAEQFMPTSGVTTSDGKSDPLATTNGVTVAPTSNSSLPYIIVAVVLAIIAVAVTVLLIVIFFVCKRKRRKTKGDPNKQKGEISSYVGFIKYTCTFFSNLVQISKVLHQNHHQTYITIHKTSLERE